MKTVSVFYENSFGIISLWKAQVLKLEDGRINLQFSAKKALGFNLTQSEFVLVCDKIVPEMDLDNQTCFDYSLRNAIKQRSCGNIAHYWNGQKWVYQKRIEALNNKELIRRINKVC